MQTEGNILKKHCFKQRTRSWLFALCCDQSISEY